MVKSTKENLEQLYALRNETNLKISGLNAIELTAVGYFILCDHSSKRCQHNKESHFVYLFLR